MAENPELRPVIVVEDEVELRSAVRDSLIRFGFEVIEAATIADARRLAPRATSFCSTSGCPRLGDGLLLCAELAGVVPIIVISARGDETDQVVALKSSGLERLLPEAVLDERARRPVSLRAATPHREPGPPREGPLG